MGFDPQETSMFTHAINAFAVAVAARIAFVTAAQPANFATFIAVGNHAFTRGPIETFARRARGGPMTYRERGKTRSVFAITCLRNEAFTVAIASWKPALRGG